MNRLVLRLIFVCIIATGAIETGHGQVDSLGWDGKEIIPLSLFTDSSRWTINSHTDLGDSIFVSTDDSCLYLHWKFGSGFRSKYAQCYLVIDTLINLSGYDIFGVDVKGQAGMDNRSVKIKFENNPEDPQANYSLENLAKIPRWCNKISILKKQFVDAHLLDWDSVRVISLEVHADSVEWDLLPDSGTVVFRNFLIDSVDLWQRAITFEQAPFPSLHDSIKEKALQALLNRQDTVTGLFCSWQYDSTSWLYGHGLVLKLLSYKGIWEDGQAMDSVAVAAEKLALFLARHQGKQGFWPRAWYTKTGDIFQYLETDSTVWMADFLWILTGLQNYYNRSCDRRVLSSLEKARTFLYSMIENNGRLNTYNPYEGTIHEVTSTEAYAAAILSFYELADSANASLLLNYIDSLSWDNELKYWKEGTTSYRTVLFANTWMASFFRNTPDSVRALEALSLAGHVLSTTGPGINPGLDGVGPVACWYEGMLSYISAGGPLSNELLSHVINSVYPDGTVPHYNDSLGSLAGIWAVPWSSLEGTAWLYFTADKISPFVILTSNSCPENEEPRKVMIHYLGWFNDSVAESIDEPLRHWDYGHAHDPLAGKYDSKSWSLAIYHMLLSWSCGINGLVINIKDDYDRLSLNNIISSLQAVKNIDSVLFQYEFAISFDDQGLDLSPPLDTAINKFCWFRDTILTDSDHYLYYYDKPALFIYNYHGKYLTANDYSNITDSLFPGHPPLLIWNECRTEEIPFLNVCYPWVQPDSMVWDTLNGLNWGSEYLEWFYDKINNTNIINHLDLACGAVWPGFDDRENTGWETEKDRWMDRRDGEVYDSTWTFIHNYQGILPLKWVIIETWNDWNEGSELEPSLEYRYDYLVSTIENINQFKGTDISIDTCKFHAAGKIYHAALMIELGIRDSLTYYPVLEVAIKCFLEDSCDCAIIATDSIITYIEHVEDIQPDIKAFPNPAGSTIYFQVIVNERTFVNIKLLNLQGQVIENIYTGELPPGENILEWNAGKLACGVYLYSLQAGNRQFTGRLVVE